MATTLKVLGQIYGTGTIYTVPAATSTVISTIVVCNIGGSATSFKIRIAIGGALSDSSQYIFNAVPLAINETKTYTLGITLAATDQIIADAFSGSSVAMNIFGQEIT